jgi:hypothetical protein
MAGQQSMYDFSKLVLFSSEEALDLEFTEKNLRYLGITIIE